MMIFEKYTMTLVFHRGKILLKILSISIFLLNYLIPKSWRLLCTSVCARRIGEFGLCHVIHHKKTSELYIQQFFLSHLISELFTKICFPPFGLCCHLLNMFLSGLKNYDTCVKFSGSLRAHQVPLKWECLTLISVPRQCQFLTDNRTSHFDSPVHHYLPTEWQSSDNTTNLNTGPRHFVPPRAITHLHR